MKKVLPPLFLVLALASLIWGFTWLARGELEPDMEIHHARVAGEEAHQKTLEDRLDRQRWLRRAAIGGLFLSAAVFGAAAFAVMGGSPSAGRKRPAGGE